MEDGMPLDSRSELWASLVIGGFELIAWEPYQALLSHYGSAKKAVEAGPGGWREAVLFDDKWLQKAAGRWDEVRSMADKEISLVEREQVSVKMWQSEDYPFLLKEISSPPPIIYIRGADQALEGPSIALVGSRRCSYYGERVAKELACGLAALGVTTTSGLARGIDSVVHRATMEAGGQTWAVLGSGLGCLYPPENKDLAMQIEKEGAVLSEFPLEAKPYPENFPRRNRIIAGLCAATVVVEGSLKSGALITARLAAEEGRSVGAVPGPIDSALSEGPHQLIQSGAKLVRNVDDIIEECSVLAKMAFERNKAGGIDAADTLDEESKKILSFIGATAVPKEDVAIRMGMDAKRFSILIMDLELNGFVRSLPGGFLAKKA